MDRTKLQTVSSIIFNDSINMEKHVPLDEFISGLNVFDKMSKLEMVAPYVKNMDDVFVDIINIFCLDGEKSQVLKILFPHIENYDIKYLKLIESFLNNKAKLDALKMVISKIKNLDETYDSLISIFYTDVCKLEALEIILPYLKSVTDKYLNILELFLLYRVNVINKLIPYILPIEYKYIKILELCATHEKAQALKLLMPYIELNSSHLVNITLAFPIHKAEATKIVYQYVEDMKSAGKDLSEYMMNFFCSSYKSLVGENDKILKIILPLYSEKKHLLRLILVEYNTVSSLISIIEKLLPISLVDIKYVMHNFRLSDKRDTEIKNLYKYLISKFNFEFNFRVKHYISAIKFNSELLWYSLPDKYKNNDLYMVLKEHTDNLCSSFKNDEFASDDYEISASYKKEQFVFDDEIQTILYYYVTDSLSSNQYVIIKKISGTTICEDLMMRAIREEKITFIKYIVSKRKPSRTIVNLVIGTPHIHTTFMKEIKWKRCWNEMLSKQREYPKLLASICLEFSSILMLIGELNLCGDVNRTIQMFLIGNIIEPYMFVSSKKSVKNLTKN